MRQGTPMAHMMFPSSWFGPLCPPWPSLTRPGPSTVEHSEGGAGLVGRPWSQGEQWQALSCPLPARAGPNRCGLAQLQPATISPRLGLGGLLLAPSGVSSMLVNQLELRGQVVAC